MAKKLAEIPTDRIRNFCIIAHIDHGKSTLADRMLEATGTIEKLEKADAQVLDTLQVSLRRGCMMRDNCVSIGRIRLD
jgi:translation elongation factor EF-4